MKKAGFGPFQGILEDSDTWNKNNEKSRKLINFQNFFLTSIHKFSVGASGRRKNLEIFLRSGRSKRRSRANLASVDRPKRRSKAIETSIHPKQYKTSASATKSKGIETFDSIEMIQNFCKCIATAFPPNVATTESFQNFCECSDLAFPT